MRRGLQTPPRDLPLSPDERECVEMPMPASEALIEADFAVSAVRPAST